MLLRASPHEVRLVLVERADRLARDLMISEILLGEFRKIGVRVVSAECETELTVKTATTQRNSSDRLWERLASGKRVSSSKS